MGQPHCVSLRPHLIRFLTAIVFLSALLPAPAFAAPPPPQRLYLPLLTRDLRQPLIGKMWQRANFSEEAGAFGMTIRNWDGVGQPEVFVADSHGISAWRDMGQYRFDQVWAAPPGVGWGFQNFDGDGAQELWAVSADGWVIAYDPYSYTPARIGQVAGAITVARVGDLFGDGQSQLLTVAADGFLRSYAWPSLKPRWERPTVNCPGPKDLRAFALLQADADPQLEIALDCGLVVDPLRPDADWRWSKEFIAVAAGNLDADAYDEMVATERLNGATRVFDVDTHSMAWEANTGSSSARALLIADVLGDALPELLVGTSTPAVYDARSHQRVWYRQGPVRSLTAIGVGDANADGKLDVFSMGPDFDYVPTLAIAPFVAGDPYVGPEFSISAPTGPPSLAALQLDDDPALEVVRFASPSLYNRDARYSIVDGLTGLAEPGLSLQLPPVKRYFIWPLVLAQGNIDGDKYDELLVAGEYTLYLLDHNGKLLAQRDSPDLSLVPDWIGDVDGDGQPEVVSHDPRRIIILTLPSLTTKWLGPDMTDGISSVKVADVDQDGRLEALLQARDRPLRAYEFASAQQEWQMPASEGARAVEVGKMDGAEDMLIVTIDSNNRLRYYNATTLAPIGSGWTAPYNGGQMDLRLVRLMSGQGPQLVVLASGAWVFRKPLDPNPFFGVYVPYPNFAYLLTDLDGDRRIDMLVSSYDGTELWEWGDPVGLAP